MKRFLSILLAVSFIIALTSVSWAVPPEAKPVTLGISPRDVAADTSDIFRKHTSGLPNVGVGETIYLGQDKEPPAEDEPPAPLTAWEWAVTARPNNSAAQLSATDLAVVSFVPDLVGTYRFSLTVVSDSGRSEAAILTVNAANWVGTGGIVGEANIPQCIVCHEDRTIEYNATKHPHMFESMISGARGYYRPTCVSCHVVGYNTDASAVNGGFDDKATAEGWAFPSDTAAQNAQTWENMKQSHPNTAAMANIGCENCHGPGSRHNSQTADAKIASTWDSEMCARCHDSGTHHFRPMQWKLSGHSNPVVEERSGCANCHSGIGFVDKLTGMHDTLVTRTWAPIGCATCHDPHDATNPYQVRTVAPYTLMNGEVYDKGVSNLCVNCHHSRSNNEVAVRGNITNRYGPHYGPQSEMLKGTNAFDMGGQVENSPHYAILRDGCIDCHMAETPEDPTDPDKFLKLGDHTFSMKTADGAEHVEACAACHGDVASFDEIGNDDWDEDGTAEGARAEITGLMERLAWVLPPADDPAISYSNALTPTQKQALWNYKFVMQDASGGMHNAKYAKSLLLNALNSDLGVETVEGTIPAEFSLSEAYPNPFNPLSAIQYNIASEGNVSIKVFDMAGREIRSIVDGNQKAGSYKASIDLTGKASGVYLLRMQAGSFDASKKLVLVK